MSITIVLSRTEMVWNGIAPSPRLLPAAALQHLHPRQLQRAGPVDAEADRHAGQLDRGQVAFADQRPGVEAEGDAVDRDPPLRHRDPADLGRAEIDAGHGQPLDRHALGPEPGDRLRLHPAGQQLPPGDGEPDQGSKQRREADGPAAAGEESRHSATLTEADRRDSR
ncbi:hypothetical protein [Inquilinus sp. Marseille-Q2685]|uniref:hypothetical protein n=1 Tax=Inquilinus sp. Marseille-Q2685 TaxID=2866581 RepID=UPI001CE3D8E9|nr:hypothetical protein [Inquilinus sp. Marseille-Q2685]